ncbi:hypothetical protein HDU76_013691, partial [Blyttiomyces sp. JEL0837]
PLPPPPTNIVKEFPAVAAALLNLGGGSNGSKRPGEAAANDGGGGNTGANEYGSFTLPSFRVAHKSWRPTKGAVYLYDGPGYVWVIGIRVQKRASVSVFTNGNGDYGSGGNGILGVSGASDAISEAEKAAAAEFGKELAHLRGHGRFEAFEEDDPLAYTFWTSLGIQTNEFENESGQPPSDPNQESNPPSDSAVEEAEVGLATDPKPVEKQEPPMEPFFAELIRPHPDSTSPIAQDWPGLLKQVHETVILVRGEDGASTRSVPPTPAAVPVSVPIVPSTPFGIAGQNAARQPAPPPPQAPAYSPVHIYRATDTNYIRCLQYERIYPKLQVSENGNQAGKSPNASVAPIGPPPSRTDFESSGLYFCNFGTHLYIWVGMLMSDLERDKCFSMSQVSNNT